MIQVLPQVSEWSTFFLYPFPFPVEKRELLPGALYERWRLLPNFSEEKYFDEVTYFFPYVRNFLFSSLETAERPVTHWQFAFPKEHPLTVSGYDDLALELISVRLHIFPFDIGILSLQVQGTTPLPFERLLDFNADFRCLTKSYREQTLPQMSLLLDEKQISETKHNSLGLWQKKRITGHYLTISIENDFQSQLMRSRRTSSLSAHAQESRYHCGNLLARLRSIGVELKCRRCKRIVLIPWGTASTWHDVALEWQEC